MFDPQTNPQQTIPLKLNLGSGKDFREDFLNIDISSQWNPDIIADLSKPIMNEKFMTRRFGEVQFKPESFEFIIAYDVLEHVPDLVALMANCRDLLKVGGFLQAVVPYDLSYGAWLDPTHVRGFNERSWLAYTDWYWYLGWKNHRFNARRIEFMVSDYGKKLMATGLSLENILLMPRAVDSMIANLEKVPLSEEDIKSAEPWVARLRESAARV